MLEHTTDTTPAVDVSALPQTDEAAPPITAAPSTDPFLPDAEDLADEYTLLWAFISAPVDEARRIATYLLPEDFYKATNAVLFSAAIEARRATGGEAGAAHVMAALQSTPVEFEHQRTAAIRLLVHIIGIDCDPTDLRPLANKVMHQAMRRQIQMLRERALQMGDEVGSEEMFTAIDTAVRKMHDTGLDRRYRKLNDAPPAQD